MNGTAELLPAEAHGQPVAVPGPVVRASFAELYDEHSAFVWRTVRALGIRPPAIDDVVQEVFLVVHRNLDTFEGRSSLRTWLYGVVRKTVWSHKRRPHADRPTADSVPDLVAPDACRPDHQLDQATAANAVVAILDSLDDDKREVFVLAELEQMSGPEIAELLEEPLNTVYSRLRLAREAFALGAARYRAQQQRGTP